MSGRTSDTSRSIQRSIEWTPAHVLVVALGTITSAIHVYVGLATGQIHFLLLGIGLFAGVILFFTVFWAPVLYLIGVIYVTTLLTIWLLAGMPLYALGVLDGIVQLGLIVTFAYLFLLEGQSRPT